MRTQLAPGTADHVVEGIRIRVTTYGGPGDGLDNSPAVLLLHGFPTSSQLWRQVGPEMCAGTDDDLFVLAPDLVQLGESERTGARIDLATQARLLLGMLDAHDVDRVIVAGHGLGGAVAVHLAALDASRVAGLALLDSPLHGDAWPVAGALPMLIPGVRAICGRALPVVPWLAERVLATLVGSGSDAAGVRPLDRYVEELRKPGAARGLVHFATAVDPVAIEAAWHVVRASPPPTLIMWGADDRVHNITYGRRVAGEIPTAAWVPVAGAGHLLPEERPERVAEELVAFHAEIAGD
ncbi:MAG TPA: alpha/beta hydrolase [Acidothermaceae bacterium]|jgi:pimeloyl-ACP methyl ester carboxylesterase